MAGRKNEGGIVSHDSAIEAEKELAALIETGDEQAVRAWLDQGGANSVEFTGRCLSSAIARGMTETACRLGELGFHLAVTDDAAAQQAIEQASGMRGLLGFLSDYRYCKAQRSYYLPVVESEASLAPVRAMQKAGLFGKIDESELLSLSLRMDRTPLARVLADGGARLVRDDADGVPAELLKTTADDATAQNDEALWSALATPQRSLETLDLVFEHTGSAPCRIYRGWWGSYGRQKDFAAKLSAIACHSDSAHCDCTGQLLETLASAGEQRGLEAVLAWNSLKTAWLDAALAAAQESGKPQAAAAIMRATSEDDALDFLDF